MNEQYQRIVDKWLRGDFLDLAPEQRRALDLVASGNPVEQADAEFVVGVKATDMFRLASSVAGPAETKAETGKNVFPWVLSDERVDRAGDIIRQNWKLDSYKDNPVLLWGHAFAMDHEADEPIGRVDNVRVEGKRLLGDVVLAADASDRAARVARLVEGGFIKAGSVGFRPMETRVVQDDAEREKLGLGRFGVVYEKSELLEFSLCAVPCNAGALAASMKAGTLREADAELLKSLGTERDWAGLARRRAQRHGTAAQIDDTELENGGGGPDLAGAFMALVEELKHHREGREADVQSRRELAVAITDLGGRLGALGKSADARRPDAGGLSSEQRKQLTKALDKLNQIT